MLRCVKNFMSVRSMGGVNPKKFVVVSSETPVEEKLVEYTEFADGDFQIKLNLGTYNSYFGENSFVNTVEAIWDSGESHLVSFTGAEIISESVDIYAQFLGNVWAVMGAPVSMRSQIEAMLLQQPEANTMIKLGQASALRRKEGSEDSYYVVDFVFTYPD